MRAAVIVTAFLLFGLTVATAESPPHMLPAGTAVVFVSAGRLDAGTRPGSSDTLKLRDPLIVDGITVAPAGTTARLAVYQYVNDTNGHRETGIALERFQLPSLGLMPLKPVEAITLPVTEGTLIHARTLAAIDHLGDRLSIRVEFPFKLSTDRPASYYTPTPARTPPPASMGPRAPRTFTPSPSPSASAAASPAATSAPTPPPTKIR